MQDVLESGTGKKRRDDALLYAYRFVNIEYDESEGSLRVAGRAVAIEPRPLRLLSELLRRPNEVVSKDELFELLWEGRPTVDNVLANAVNKLRKALGAEGAERIVNLPRVGYRLNGPIERTAVGQQVAADLQLKAGEPVPGRDAYRLERVLGRTPGGEVWLAHDPKLQTSRVFKFATDSERLTALKREYTLYRVLRKELGERQDFARIVSANFATAPYFLECEYGGQDLLAWSADGDRLTGMPTAERLVLFLQIARAVAAAHGVGVLHKDLKPANVLISRAGEGWAAKLTDFGSSRLLDPARLAELGVTAMGLTVTQRNGGDSVGGTPLYLAPELIAGNAPSTQSDLYALGLMLYQLLIGDLRRPMSTGWQREIDDELLCEDLTAATEGRLDHRLGSVAEFAERLASLDRRRADRDRRTAEASEAGAALAALDQARQRRPWIIGGFVSLALGLASSLWFFYQARTSLAETQKQMARAQSINSFLNEDVLQSADITALDVDKPATMLEVLKKASASASERFRGDALTEASVRMELGVVFQRMGTYAAAEGEYRRALTLRATFLAPGDPALLQTRFTVAQLLAESSKLEEAEQQLALAESNTRPEVLKSNPRLEFDAVNARFSYACMHQDFKQAQSIGERAVALADQTPADDLSRRFSTRHRLADVAYRLGDFKQAQALLTTILNPPYTTKVVGETMFSRGRIELARVRLANGEHDGVEAMLIEARNVVVSRLGPKEYYGAVANLELANLYNARGDFARARAVLQAAYATMVAGFGEAHQSTRITALNLAITEINAGNAAVGLAGLNRGRAQFVADFGGADSAVVQSIDFQRARALSDLHRSGEAGPLLDRLSDAKLAEAEPARDWQWRLQAEKARALIGTGQRDTGLPMLESAVAEMEALGSPEWGLTDYRTALKQR